MEFTTAHRFDHPLDAVAAALLDPEAHVGRHRLMGARDIVVLAVRALDGGLELTTVRTVDGEVPAFAQALVASTNTITSTDRWRRGDDRTVRGTIDLAASAVPGSAHISATLAADGAHACAMDVVLDLRLAIPLIGARFAKVLRPQVMQLIGSELEGWERWLAGGGASAPT